MPPVARAVHALRMCSAMYMLRRHVEHSGHLHFLFHTSPTLHLVSAENIKVTTTQHNNKKLS